MVRKINFGVIGAGRIGKVHTATLVQKVSQANVIAVADVHRESAEELGEKFDIPLVATNYRDIIEHENVDAIVICSPTNTHVQYIKEAAELGKHIFCEKPIDTDLKKIQTALDAVKKAGVKLMIGFNRRFDPNFNRIHQMVVEGKIGEPHILKITSRDPGPPPLEYIAGSGGMFVDMSLHDFDMARYITGSEVKEVFAKAAVLVDPEIGKAGDIDTAIISLTFENGALGVIDNSRKAVYGYDQRLEIFGSGGMVNVDNNYPDNHRYYNGNGVHKTLPLNFFMDRYLEAYAVEMSEFCDSVIHDKEPSVNGKDGYMSVAIALAANKSRLENRVVKMSEILGDS